MHSYSEVLPFVIVLQSDEINRKVCVTKGEI